MAKRRLTTEQRKANKRTLLRNWRAANPEKVKKYNATSHRKKSMDLAHKTGACARAAKHRLKLVERSPATLLLYAAKDRAKRRGVPFAITEADVPIPLACPLLGVWMLRNGPYAPSIDCMEPAKGYVPGNVWVISKKANLMKNNATREELATFARNVVRLLG